MNFSPDVDYRTYELTESANHAPQSQSVRCNTDRPGSVGPLFMQGPHTQSSQSRGPVDYAPVANDFNAIYNEDTLRTISRDELQDGPWKYAQSMYPLFVRIAGLGACVIVYTRFDAASRNYFFAVRRVDPEHSFIHSAITGTSRYSPHMYNHIDEKIELFEVPDRDPAGRIEYPELLVVSIPTRHVSRDTSRGRDYDNVNDTIMKPTLTSTPPPPNSRIIINSNSAIGAEADGNYHQQQQQTGGGETFGLIGAPVTNLPDRSNSNGGSKIGAPVITINFKDDQYNQNDGNKLTLLTRGGELVYMAWDELTNNRDTRVQEAVNYLLKQFPGLMRYFFARPKPSTPTYVSGGDRSVNTRYME